MALLDPFLIAQLGSLELKAKRILDGLYAGRYINRVRGTSQEFSDHRGYNPGDEIRQIDWKIFGRTDRLVVKQYLEETNITGLVLLDSSASMNFSFGGRFPKLDYAKVMAAALGYLLIHQGDAAGLLTQDKHVSPSNSRGFLETYLKEIDSLVGRGVWSMTRMGERLGTLMKRRSLLLVLSDLMGDPETIFNSLKALQTHKHEILVFQILDPAERDLPFEGASLFEDLESRETLRTDATALRKAYRKFVDERLGFFEQVFRRAGIEYTCLTTDTPFERGLGAYLSWRKTFL